MGKPSIYQKSIGRFFASPLYLDINIHIIQLLPPSSQAGIAKGNGQQEKEDSRLIRPALFTSVRNLPLCLQQQ